MGSCCVHERTTLSDLAEGRDWTLIDRSIVVSCACAIILVERVIGCGDSADTAGLCGFWGEKDGCGKEHVSPLVLPPQLSHLSTLCSRHLANPPPPHRLSPHGSGESDEYL